ncbi:MAG: hypothetical protein WA901_03830 [Phormidesmis sp.]
MAQKYGLWGAIAGIFIAAILGVRSAANWLNGSALESNPDSAISVDSDNSNLPGADAQTGDTTQTNTRFADQSDTPEGETVTFSPLEEAGTYIQRQKSVELDSVVASTSVEAVPVADAEPVSAQPNTPVEQPTPDASTQPTTAPAAPVPALW